MWTERHRPKEMSLVAGNPEAKDKLAGWARKWKKGGKAALLVGPPGVGKTTTVHLLAAKLGLNLVELNASDTRTKGALSKKLTEAVSSTTLEGVGTLVFLDEVDGLAGRADYGAVEFIKDAVRRSANPVVMAANDPESDEVRKLSSVATKIQFLKPTAEEVVSVLEEIAAAEGVEAEPGMLAEIAGAANGDFRAAINALQSGLPSAKDEEVTRERSIDGFFDALSQKEALRAIRGYPGQAREKVRDLFVAVAKAKIHEERRAAALDVVSRADLLLGRIFVSQDWRLLRYLDTMLVAELWPAVGDAGAKYSADATPWPLQVRIWNDSKKLKDIAALTGRRLGVSVAGGLVEDVPYLMRLCADRRFREAFVSGLELEENYAAFVEKEAARAVRG